MAAVTRSKGAGEADIVCLQATRCAYLSITFEDRAGYVAFEHGVSPSYPKVEIADTTLLLVDSDINR